MLFAASIKNKPKDSLERSKLDSAKDKCPFEDPEASGNKVLATYHADGFLSGTEGAKYSGSWFAKVLENKYSVVKTKYVIEKAKPYKSGPFDIVDAVGMQEVVIFKDHDRPLTKFSAPEMTFIFKIYKERFIEIAKSCASDYILIFNNYGAMAGASKYHPHSQIISTPVLPPDVERSITGSEEFYKKNGRKVYDVMIEWELREKERIIYENDEFVALCPFVSKTPYEVRVFPKSGSPYFEEISEDILMKLGDILSKVFNKINEKLGNPDFNFFVHTSPLNIRKYDNKAEDFYTWHVEILPKISLAGGFELGSGIYVNVVDPNEAAKILKISL